MDAKGLQMVRQTILTMLFCGLHELIAQGSFSPQAGSVGSTAIHKDSVIFRDWAISCQVRRGKQQINLPDSGEVSSGIALYALGGADAPLTVSLGDSGVATLTFSAPFHNGEGPDFAVFENGFGMGESSFLELAFVEVSSDGTHFFRFPAESEFDTVSQQGTFAQADASYYHNLAGKYIANYGVPFDLSEIPDTILLDKSAVTHVRVIDVVGCIQPNYASRDSFGRIINDPWPTNFDQGGFDLDAVGIIHSNIPLGVATLPAETQKDQTQAFDLYGRPIRSTSNGLVIIHGEVRANLHR